MENFTRGLYKYTGGGEGGGVRSDWRRASLGGITTLKPLIEMSSSCPLLGKADWATERRQCGDATPGLSFKVINDL